MAKKKAKQKPKKKNPKRALRPNDVKGNFKERNELRDESLISVDPFVDEDEPE